jgi:hypothetical protein
MRDEFAVGKVLRLHYSIAGVNEILFIHDKGLGPVQMGRGREIERRGNLDTFSGTNWRAVRNLFVLFQSSIERLDVLELNTEK